MVEPVTEDEEKEDKGNKQGLDESERERKRGNGGMQ